ncbi:MAG: hypothetical protein COS76_00100 [Candidatus Portnoybacteria bacterium CG06_land_8_20_14_3_00_39_12]|uniref:ParB-like N-terminal domain-containing protein n=1 Tax=Candidatus Portnoybacteria bacterium CG06_land_8_20_14_3_00_39_12 TaxID=1974809 RepID=A0A2M7AY55_9BACT|nr:MAG: hypothetical protein COS76_00100 [Candidatus Portnoybacteria bacterium CG06_land_8_20_14_3_00_39_12]
MKISIVEIKKLRPHEKINPQRLKQLRQKISADQKIRNPIIVDKNSFAILDGHHRTAVIRSLGLKKIPAYLVNYQSRDIKVLSRRTNIKVSKEMVLSHALSGKKLPVKTTRHIVPYRPRNINIPLKILV